MIRRFAGQGSVALELLAYRPSRILVPIGGGGLASGIALVMARHRIPVFGVQVTGVDSMRRLLSGETALKAVAPTIADGIRVARPGRTTAALCSRYLTDVLTVGEAEVLSTMSDLFFDEELVVEGAGAVAAAALDRFGDGQTCAIVSGGNIDPRAFAQVPRGDMVDTPQRLSAIMQPHDNNSPEDTQCRLTAQEFQWR